VRAAVVIEQIGDLKDYELPAVLRRLMVRTGSQHKMAG
jgi:hypothetical protein